MSSNKINAENAPKPVGLYPHARKVGNLLFLSGVGPRKAGSGPNDSHVPGLELDHNGNFKSFDFEAQRLQNENSLKVSAERLGLDPKVYAGLGFFKRFKLIKVNQPPEI